MERMAICVLAHKDELQLNRLIQSLDSEYFDIFIHVDKKSDLNAFKKVINKTEYSRVEYVRKRFSVLWGDISIVDATLEMMQEAWQFGKKWGGYKRYINLSGLDYPIKPNEQIYEELDNDTEFIMGNRLESAEYHKLECCYFWHFPMLNMLSAQLYKIMHYKFRKKYYIDKHGNRLDVYFAPQWHALTSSCVEYIFTFLDNNPNYRMYFKYSYAPDEMFIPTIVFNSRYCFKVLKDEFPSGTHYNEKTAIHFLNYEPIVEEFNEEAFDSIVSSNKLFVRKVTSEKSVKLLMRINEYRKQKK